MLSCWDVRNLLHGYGEDPTTNKGVTPIGLSDLLADQMTGNKISTTVDFERQLRISLENGYRRNNVACAKALGWTHFANDFRHLHVAPTASPFRLELSETIVLFAAFSAARHPRSAGLENSQRVRWKSISKF